MFQSMMDLIFANLMDNCMVIIYMDDIFIFAKILMIWKETQKSATKTARKQPLP